MMHMDALKRAVGRFGSSGMDFGRLAMISRRGVAALTAVLALAACDDGITDTDDPGGGDPGNGAATLSVFLKDAPGDVDSVWVQVDDVLLVGDDAPLSILEEPTGLLNITALRDSAVALTEGLEIDPGTYGQIRFVIGGAVLEASDGEVYVQGGAEHPGGLPATGDLQCPSCSQSGIKVKLGQALQVEEGENGLLLDFDVSQSFGHQAGNSGKWVMRPVIHAAQGDPDEIEDDEAGGDILGTVALGETAEGEPVTIPVCGGEERTLEQFLPLAVATTLVDEDTEPLTFAGAVSEEDGSFVFEIEVTEFDTYALGYMGTTVFGEEQLVWTAEVEPADVTLDESQDQATGVSYLVTGASCEPVEPNDPGDPGNPGTAASTLSVFLKDAPGDVDSVWVQVEDVLLVGDDGPLSILEEPTGLLNITALVDSAVALTEGLEIEPGSYDQIRFVIGGAVLEASDGEVYVQGGAEHPGGLPATGDLQCPSCSQSGIKVKIGQALQMEEGENGLLLDFDVSQSFGKQAGNSGKWVMRPVIHAAQGDPDEIEDDEAGGEILGTVALGETGEGAPVTIPVCGGEERTLEQFLPLAVTTTLVDEDEEPLTFAGAVSEEDDGFVFGIEVTEFDTYAMDYAGTTVFGDEQLVWTAEVEPTEVTLDETQDQATGVAYVVTGVTCEAVNAAP